MGINAGRVRIFTDVRFLWPPLHETVRVRLRLWCSGGIGVFPVLLGQLIRHLSGDGGIVGLRIGAPLFVSQRELALATLPRLRPELLAAQMAGEYLQHDRR